MVYWEWGVNKTFECRRTSQRNVWRVPWHKTSTRLHLQYHAKTYMAKSQLQVSKCNNYSLLPGHHLLQLLFPFLLSMQSVVFLPLLASQLTFITHARTYTQGRADKNLPHSKGEEEETRKTAEDDVWLTAKVISYGSTLYTHSGKLLLCLQQQGLSLPEWRKMCTPSCKQHGWHKSKKHPSSQASAPSDRAVQTLPSSEKSNYDSGGNPPKFWFNVMKHMHLQFRRR